MQKKNHIFNKNFAERLAVLFNKETQSSVSKRLDCSQGLLSNYLKGEIPDTISLLSKLANEYSVDLHLLITGETYGPQKRLETHHRDLFKQYNDLVLELEEARKIVNELGGKKDRGTTLTPEEENRLLENLGRVRSLPKMMERSIKHQAEILKAMQQE